MRYPPVCVTSARARGGALATEMDVLGGHPEHHELGREAPGLAQAGMDDYLQAPRCAYPARAGLTSPVARPPVVFTRRVVQAQAGSRAGVSFTLSLWKGSAGDDSADGTGQP